jgi:DNA-binding response OmpR family regulator
METPIHILVVEDDPNMSFLLKNNLEQEGYAVYCCNNGAEAWKIFSEMTFHLCLLDVMLPKQDGFTLATMMRRNSTVPILFLTARTLKEDVYKGFEIGADDYITKPFTARELLLRIQAVLRRTAHNKQSEQQTVYRIGELRFNYVLREIKGREQAKKLSTKENELLRMFCESRNTVLGRSRILIEVWGNDDYFVSKSLDVYITKLRKLLSEDPNISIMNYHGVGYKMVERADTPAL